MDRATRPARDAARADPRPLAVEQPLDRRRAQAPALKPGDRALGDRQVLGQGSLRETTPLSHHSHRSRKPGLDLFLALAHGRFSLVSARDLSKRRTTPKRLASVG